MQSGVIKVNRTGRDDLHDMDRRADNLAGVVPGWCHPNKALVYYGSIIILNNNQCHILNELRTRHRLPPKPCLFMSLNDLLFNALSQTLSVYSRLYLLIRSL